MSGFSRSCLGAGLAVSVLAQAVPAAAQTVEVAPFVGYRFGGGLVADRATPYDPAIYRDFDLAASASYGVVVDVAAGRRLKIEALASQRRARIEAPGFFGPKGPTMVVDQFLVGVQRPFVYAPVRPFLSGLLGFTRYHPDVEGAGSETRFGLALGGGVTLDLGRHYGVRADVRASTQFGGSGAGFSCGFGGCGFGLGGWGSWDGEVAGAFVFVF
jgi:hypothetical protein